MTSINRASKKAFISYAHKDKRYFKNLVEGLKSNSDRSHQFQWRLWDDRQIILGANWQSAIDDAIKTADFAILLISADFINSEFCSVVELGEFVKKKSQSDFIFFPILIRDCDFTKLESISETQLFVAHGDDYGLPKKEGEMISYAELLRFDNDNVAIPNPDLDTFHKNLVKAIENAIGNRLSDSNMPPSQLTSGGNPKEPIQSVQLASEHANDQFYQLNFSLTRPELLSDISTNNNALLSNHETINQAINELLTLKLNVTDQLKATEMLFAGKVFNNIVASAELDFSLSEDIRQFMGQKGRDEHQWFERSLIVSALNISIISSFNERKADLLFEFIIENEDKVWQNALIGLIFGLNRIYKRIDNYPTIKDKLNRLKEIPEVQHAIVHIIEFTNSLSREKINSKFAYDEHTYFDDLYRRFIPFHEKVELLQVGFKQSELNVDALKLGRLLANSISLNKEEKYRVAACYPTLNESQVNNLTEIFEQEIVQFSKLEQQYPDDVKNLTISKLVEELFVFAKSDADSKIGQLIEQKKSISSSGLIDLVLLESNKLKIQADLLISAEHYQDALKHLKTIELNDPNSAYNCGRIGFCLQKLDDYKEALKYHKKSEEVGPEDSWNLDQIGYCFQFLEDYKEALNYHKKSEELYPEDPWNLRQIGFCLQKQKDYKQALNYLKKSDEIEPGNSWNLNQIGFCLHKQEDYKEALNYLRKSEKLEPNKSWNLRQIGFCLQKQKDYKEALNYHKKSEEIDPGNSWNFSQIGFCLQKQEDYKEALNYHKKSEELDPDDSWNISQVGRCYDKLDDDENAWNYLKRAYDLDSSNPHICFHISWYHFKRNRLEEAKKWFLKTNEIEIFSATLMNLGHIELCFGNRTNAVDLYKQSIAKLGDDELFHAEFIDDYQYIRPSGVNEVDYLEILDALFE